MQTVSIGALLKIFCRVHMRATGLPPLDPSSLGPICNYKVPATPIISVVLMEVAILSNEYQKLLD